MLTVLYKIKCFFVVVFWVKPPFNALTESLMYSGHLPACSKLFFERKGNGDHGLTQIKLIRQMLLYH